MKDKVVQVPTTSTNPSWRLKALSLRKVNSNSNPPKIKTQAKLLRNTIHNTSPTNHDMLAQNKKVMENKRYNTDNNLQTFNIVLP
jgi:hypothetical protein